MNVAVSDEPRWLAKKSLAESGDFVLEAVECRCGATGWSPPEAASGYGIVFVRRGCFHRRLNGIESFVDPTVVYFERPEDEQQIAHPAGGDSCTVLYLSEGVLSAIWGGEPGLPDEPLASDATTDLRHRWLQAAVMRGRRRRHDGGRSRPRCASARAIRAEAVGLRPARNSAGETASRCRCPRSPC